MKITFVVLAFLQVLGLTLASTATYPRATTRSSVGSVPLPENGHVVKDISERELDGLWRVDVEKSDSFAPFLQAAGAPGFVARLLAKALNRDILDISQSGSHVNVFYKRGSGLPFKMQTDISYTCDKGEHTIIKTPVGDQRGMLMERKPDMVRMERHGPKVGEHIEDLFVALGDDKLLYQVIHHSPDGKQTKVNRVFVRHSV
uniref:Uncharacterized protein n=1 Tax=Grammatophora oceanica TaxID=210454 RepID=A0A7S1YI10_9STRA|mmetsp:Transcript_47681/g.70972  ORF Transcript_47681/g.70972 Transcript_47681/m.70972 type:complete len:202 (+) Transcript_47681:78-683(+)|eukprot:CAMPEP_0194026824 /NCGR_PEP_ID=MMETSP0009_2-20130614/1086_1 /TAXON_ID=210454 /ORGANISM="Grammatophora oceanica, Strain CCMP 410" /LENGTH=201 /DNA_ID=CAMNT_0038665689 /DNA_START=71 /DNA_END=676 /DNA_ORIENTATION=+